MHVNHHRRRRRHVFPYGYLFITRPPASEEIFFPFGRDLFSIFIQIHWAWLHGVWSWDSFSIHTVTLYTFGSKLNYKFVLLLMLLLSACMHRPIRNKYTSTSTWILKWTFGRHQQRKKNKLFRQKKNILSISLTLVGFDKMKYMRVLAHKYNTCVQSLCAQVSAFTKYTALL